MLSLVNDQTMLVTYFAKASVDILKLCFYHMFSKLCFNNSFILDSLNVNNTFFLGAHIIFHIVS
jgi:hypothetical protein